MKDGQSRRAGGRETMSVIVICGKGDARCTFILVPKEWDKQDFPAATDLGVNGRDSQGARHFILQGDLPAAVRAKLAAYFGLETP